MAVSVGSTDGKQLSTVRVVLPTHSARVRRESSLTSSGLEVGRRPDVPGKGVGRLRRAEVETEQKRQGSNRGGPEERRGRPGQRQEETRRERQERWRRRGGSKEGVLSDATKIFMHEGRKPSKKVPTSNSVSAGSVPGANASTVNIRCWWSAAFRILLQIHGGLCSFFRSLFRPATPGCESTASLWPMPLPYPAVLRRIRNSEVDGAADGPFSLAVNLAVLILNWLHLRRPFTAPAEILLGRKLSRSQWRVVRHLEHTMEASRTASPVSAFDMGRTASKIEDFEGALGKLWEFEETAAATIVGNYDRPLAAGSKRLHSEKVARAFAPGLRRAPPGEVLGAITGSSHMTARPIQSDRLEFRGEPSFNPCPSLPGCKKQRGL